MPDDTKTSAPWTGAPESAAHEPPRSVRSAVILLGCSWALGVVVIFLDLEGMVLSRSRSTEVWTVLALVALYYGFLLWLIRSIGRKRSWPRFFLLAVVALNCISLLLWPRYYFSHDIGTTGFLLSQQTLQLSALCLLFFKSARLWSGQTQGKTASNNRLERP